MASPSRHAVPVRKVKIPFDASIPRHWFGGRAFETHFFNGLNLLFPAGERFFIEAVRAHLPRIEDPELREQVRGFFGQEGRHAHEHERYFEVLERQGYRIRRFLRRYERAVAWETRWLPARLRLAITAGAEHYTAVFGAWSLRDRFVDQAHPSMRRLILWHAAEEIEHKAVAFDVLQATHPSWLLRLFGFVLATVLLFGWAGFATRMLLRQDGYTHREIRALRAKARARDDRSFERELRAATLAYLRRDFHPNQVDDLPLARRRLAELGYTAPEAA